MSTAILSRLVTFGLIAFGAGYVVLANTTPSTSAASMVSEQYRSDIVQPTTAQTPAQVALAREQQRYSAMTKEELQEELKPHTFEVQRPRSPFLERMPRLIEPEPEVAAVAKVSARETTKPKATRTKGRRIRTTNPFAGLFQPMHRAFQTDAAIRETNQSIFGPRSNNKRRTASGN